MTIVLEPLNKDETNVLNSVADGISYVDAMDRPKVRLLADFYHMKKGGEDPDSIRKAGDRIRHCHVAELEGRSPPGSGGSDISGYFKALKEIGYKGGISCECRWPDADIEAAWASALASMRELSIG